MPVVMSRKSIAMAQKLNENTVAEKRNKYTDPRHQYKRNTKMNWINMPKPKIVKLNFQKIRRMSGSHSLRLI